MNTPDPNVIVHEALDPLMPVLILLAVVCTFFSVVDISGKRKTSHRRKNTDGTTIGKDGLVATTLNLLVRLPWWMNVILAAIVYVFLSSLEPATKEQKLIFPILHTLAPILTLLLLFVAVVSAMKSWKRIRLLDKQQGIKTILRTDWKNFELLVGEAYRRKGFVVTETGGGGADGGTDLIFTKGEHRFLVQCKHWKVYRVGVKVIREHYGVVVAENASGGLVITSGTFTQEAKDFAQGKPLKLIDGNELQQLIAEVQNGTMTDNNSDYSVKPDLITDSVQQQGGTMDYSPTCPICGDKMVLRTARRGPNAGEHFWGCCAFPRCRGTKPYR